MTERSFKVIALAVGGKNNKIYRSGDTVYPKNFPDGNVDRLVNEGFLQEIIKKETVQEVVSTGTGDLIPNPNETKVDGLLDANPNPAPEGEKEGVDKSEIVDPIEAIKRPGINEITTKELKKKLQLQNVPFDSNASKEDLYDLLNYVS